jgi:hypothetical protein
LPSSLQQHKATQKVLGIKGYGKAKPFAFSDDASNLGHRIIGFAVFTVD